MIDSARIVYAGTPEFALPPAQALRKAGFNIVAVYSQPDRKAGRGRKLKASPVKNWALKNGLTVEQPETLRPEHVQAKLAEFEPDLMIVTAYGLILPPEVLAIPRCGCINLHASLLPRWRGAAPIQHAILSGDKETGVTLMQINTGLDTGLMLAKRSLKIRSGETSAEIHDRLASLAAELMLDNINNILSGEIVGEQQLEDDACYANKIKKEQAWIDWQCNARDIARQVAAFNPWPVAQTLWADQVLRIWRAVSLVEDVPAGFQPGQIIASSAVGIDIACGQGVLRVTELQLPAARVVSSADFINAHKLSNVILG